MKHILLVDGNSIGYAAQNSRPLKTGAGEPVQAIFNMLRTIKNLRNDNPHSQILLLWDSPKLWRYDVYPEYKGNRESTPEMVEMRNEFRAQRPQIVRALYHLGVNQLSANGFEADDLAAFLAPYYARKGFKVDLVSGDKDWLQVVDENISWIDPINNRTCTHANFAEMTDCETQRDFVDTKALVGDKSDNMGGVPGIGAKTAASIMRDLGGIDALFELYEKNGAFEKGSLPADMSRARNKINAFCSDESIRAIFDLNRKIMDLKAAPKPKSNDLKITKGKKNMSKFQSFCEERQFKSILRELAMWDAIFRGTV
ncbi:MAG: 5'-3' exonuclease H3TH domain-containing protein [Vibrio splendidus]